MFKSYRTYKVEEIMGAYDDGRRAFRDGYMPDSNPFPKKDETLCEQWLQGWHYEKWVKERELNERADKP
jgi:hypothetical protein